MSRLPVGASSQQTRSGCSVAEAGRPGARTGRRAAGWARVIALAGVAFMVAVPAHASVPPPRPQGPCDIYAAAGTPCVAAHSTTRALYAGYGGPLYEVKRLSDDAVKDIGAVASVGGPFPDAGGYADAARTRPWCEDTLVMPYSVTKPFAAVCVLLLADRGHDADWIRALVRHHGA